MGSHGDHIWLNEGFATYYALLFDGHQDGPDAMLYGLWGDARRILGANDSPRPIVNRKYENASAQFGYRSYQKGGWVLHMLRSQLGEDLYRECIQTYLERHALQSVVTEDLRSVIEELSGRSFDRFFDQWLYHSKYPELAVTYRWQAAEKLAKVSIRQTQNFGDDVMLFSFPLTIRFKSKSGTVDREVEVFEDQHDFYFPLDEAPTLVRVDPEYTLLAKVNFNKPNAMLYEQLADHGDMIGRLLAIQSLRTKRDRQSVAKLEEALSSDPFHAVRSAASRALRDIHTDAALDALLASTDQSDARVRRQVTTDIGGFYSERSLSAIIVILDSETNPEVAAAAIQSLGKYDSDEVRRRLLEYLNSRSYRQTLASAAIGAIRSLDDPSYIGALQKCLAEREGDFTSRGFAQGLGAVAYIARNEDDRSGVRRFLAGYVNHKKVAIQSAAIGALGQLRDPQAISIVATFSSEGENRRVRRAAQQALRSLRSAQDVPVELSSLRSEVLELKEQNESLKKDFEDLKTQIEAQNGNSGNGSGRNGRQRGRRGFLGLFGGGASGGNRE
ncbi:HEAT repeat domain-containing protein [Candidatus Sumerlaeota bacterium]|nr:HEAT repeat domain-containing protein [Candidatus Sumerlaeota bacterium]